MRYSTEWNGHKIEWEFFAMKRKAYLFLNDRLFIDGVEYENTDMKVRFAGTHKVTIEHDGREVSVELYARAGLIGLQSKIKVDDEEIARKYVPIWRFEKWGICIFNSMIVALLFSLIVINVVSFLFFGIRPVVKVKKMPVENVAGIFFYVDSLGNLMKYEPAIGFIDTIYSNDSMAVRDLSPDGKSVVLIMPKQYERGEKPPRKVYWLTLDDNEMRLIGEWKQAHPYASFTPDGENIYLAYSDSIWSKGVIADTLGNVRIFDGSVFGFNSTMTQCFGQRHKSMPWKLFDIETGESTELDTILFPKDHFPRRWSDDIVVIKTWEKLKQELYFIDLKTLKADTISFSAREDVDVFTNVYTVNYYKGFILYSLEILKQFSVFDSDKELWSIMTYSDYPQKVYSDKEQILMYSYSLWKYRVISSEGTTDPLPITGRVLLWK